MKQYLPWINIGSALVALAGNHPAPQRTDDGGDLRQVPSLVCASRLCLCHLGHHLCRLDGFAVYQALPAQRANPRLQRISWLFALANIANAAWLFTWHFELFPLSAIVILSLLALLIAIYWRLNIGRVQVSAREKWLVDLPFGIYLGWISVATIANISDLL